MNILFSVYEYSLFSITNDQSIAISLVIRRFNVLRLFCLGPSVFSGFVSKKTDSLNIYFQAESSMEISKRYSVYVNNDPSRTTTWIAWRPIRYPKSTKANSASSTTVSRAYSKLWQVANLRRVIANLSAGFTDYGNLASCFRKDFGTSMQEQFIIYSRSHSEVKIKLFFILVLLMKFLKSTRSKFSHWSHEPNVALLFIRSIFELVDFKFRNDGVTCLLAITITVVSRYLDLSRETKKISR